MHFHTHFSLNNLQTYQQSRCALAELVNCETIRSSLHKRQALVCLPLPNTPWVHLCGIPFSVLLASLVMERIESCYVYVIFRDDRH